jgi:hypothetical protein
MSRRRCCGPTDPHVPDAMCYDVPTGWNARTYRIVLPRFDSMSQGRVIPGVPLDLEDSGICAGNASHPGWAATLCEYIPELYHFHRKRTFPKCTGSGLLPFCHEAFGPCTQYVPASNIAFSGSDLNATNSYSKSYYTNFGGSGNWAQRSVFLCRCSLCEASAVQGFPGNANRTYLSVSINIRCGYNVQDCAPSGPTSLRYTYSGYYARYYSDPWTASEGIAPRVYLKQFNHEQTSYGPSCDGNDFNWTVNDQCRKSWEKGTLLDFPINVVPTEIEIERLT